MAGNWIWGGGWLANLGSNLGLAHGIRRSGRRRAGQPARRVRPRWRASSSSCPGVTPGNGDGPVPLPPSTFPLLSLLGVGLVFIGLPAWSQANPLLAPQVELQRLLLNSLVAAGGAALLSVGYTWLVAGRPDPLMGARAAGGAVVASLAAAPFIPTWGALALGALIGLLTPIAIFVVDRVLRWDDPTAALTVHGLAAALGLVAVGLIADGTAGAGWNGIGAGQYLGVEGQGVTGLLAAAGFRPDFPLQLQAQLVAAGSLVLFAFFAAWLFLAPLATAALLLRPRRDERTGGRSRRTASVQGQLLPQAAAEGEVSAGTAASARRSSPSWNCRDKPKPPTPPLQAGYRSDRLAAGRS